MAGWSPRAAASKDLLGAYVSGRLLNTLVWGTFVAMRVVAIAMLVALPPL